MTTPDPDRDGETPAPDPEPRAPLDVDSTFAAIVAHWDDEDDARPWPEQENVAPPVVRTAEPGSPENRDPAGASDAGDGDRPAGDLVENSPVDGRSGDPRVIRPAMPDPFAVPPSATEAELDERFIPPEPPPLPRGDLFSRLAWAGVLGGPLFLLLAAMMWKEAPQMLVLLAVGAFIGGFVGLVLRLPQNHDDDGDDGAVV